MTVLCILREVTAGTGYNIFDSSLFAWNISVPELWHINLQDHVNTNSFWGIDHSGYGLKEQTPCTTRDRQPVYYSGLFALFSSLRFPTVPPLSQKNNRIASLLGKRKGGCLHFLQSVHDPQHCKPTASHRIVTWLHFWLRKCVNFVFSCLRRNQVSVQNGPFGEWSISIC